MRSAISLVYSPNAERLHADIVDCGIGSEQDFARVLGDAPLSGSPLQGKIAMVTTANPENRPSIHRREKYGRAVAAGAVGFIYVNHRPGLLAETGSLRPGRLAEIPAVGVSYEDGWELARRCRRGRLEVELTIRNQAGPGQGGHVVGSVVGGLGGQKDDTIVIGAHYDGHDVSQGALDDATGTVVVLELARILSPLSGQLKRTIRLIAFDAEELGVLGSAEYVKAHQNDLGNVALMINLDSAYGPVATHGFLTGGFKDTEAVLRGYAKEFGYALSLRDRVVTASDNFPFFMQGIPAICMSARAENTQLGRGFGHTAADTLDKVAEVDVKAAVMTIARMAVRLANHEGTLGARKSREETKQVLIEQDLEKSLRAQDKWPF
ncbi:MAG: M28 family peptidase [Chloroflexi bacterium]|nr:M28 family peptidase [Chloroflexota bacterium]